MTRRARRRHGRALFKSRVRRVAVSFPWVALILVVLVFRGGAAVLPPVDDFSPKLSDGGLAQQAKAMADLGDYEKAWDLYYRALQAAPEDIALWYGLGVTLSHLNKLKETEEVFQYVLRHGRPDSEEVRVARGWLVSAGVLVKPAVFTVTPAPVADARGNADKAAVRGTVAWSTPEPGRPPLTVRLLLHGLNGLAEGKRFYARAALGESYRFERLPPGSYHLIGAAARQHLWDLTLSVEDGREVVLDLNKDNSSTPTVALFR